MCTLMQLSSLSRRLSFLATTLIAGTLAGAGCGNQIGDACRVNLDCSPLGDRFCDVSAPGGYCTIEGCDNRSCPNGSVCIRFFQPIPTRPCTPLTASTDCAPSERCLCDFGAIDAQGNCPPSPDGMSVADLAHCAPESSERRWCQRRCSSDRNCRDDTDNASPPNRLYECRQSGTQGSEPIPESVTDAGVPVGTPVKFCVQRKR
jgi:hypothetical protein